MTQRSRIDRRSHRPQSRREQRGLSLLETILAIAILGGTLAVIGESVRVGSMAAADAREMTMAQLLCESKLAELTAGLQQLTSTGLTAVEVAPDWQYTVQVENSAQQGLIMIGVTVTRDRLQDAPVSVTLFRWIIDPELTAQIETAAAEQEALEAENSSSSSSSNSSGSGGSGGSSGQGGGSNNGGR